MARFLFIRYKGAVIRPSLKIKNKSVAEYLLPDVIVSLSVISSQTDFKIVILSSENQKNQKSMSDYQILKEEIIKLMKNQGIQLKEITDTVFYQTFGKKLFKQMERSQSFIVTPVPEDIRFAAQKKIPVINFNDTHVDAAVISSCHWIEIASFLKFGARHVKITRKTSETDIKMKLNIDGQGKSEIQSPIGFLTHMLELLARHSGFDVVTSIKGDIHVDEHHTVEDTAIVLGQAVTRALGKKEGISRYGFFLPMDEARAEVAIDLSGRSYLTWKVKFKREKVGRMPTELFYHFFKSFSDHAQCTLYIKARGKNDHHKIEAIFKAFARSLKMAVRRDPDITQIPSTKGVL